MHLVKGRFKRKNGHSARSCKNARANSQIDHTHAHILIHNRARARTYPHRYSAPCTSPRNWNATRSVYIANKKIRTDRFSYSLLINEFLQSNNARFHLSHVSYISLTSLTSLTCSDLINHS